MGKKNIHKELNKLGECLRELSDKERVVIVGTYYWGYPDKALAELITEPEADIKPIREKAINKLEILFKTIGLTVQYEGKKTN